LLVLEVKVWRLETIVSADTTKVDFAKLFHRLSC
jgi:hypothetical protein